MDLDAGNFSFLTVNFKKEKFQILSKLFASLETEGSEN